MLSVVLGVTEISFLMKDDIAVSSLVRTGGRIASANAGAGPGGTNEEGDCVAPCSPANAPMFAQLAANAMQQAGTALPRESIQELWVYQANTLGFPGTATTEATAFAACPTNCVRYKWQPSKNQFRYLSGTWASSTVNACANNSPDAVGVYLKARHLFLTGLFKNAVDIADHAVFTFEPLPTLTCATGSHA